ncbi:uncharacterized protein LOC6031152 [Culex quinquefasciatus]|uniref:uncharacterized protein LOC6031152 n=1 Tax=Culex quinquefasciatus TaxID=7176 RepID=UPI0018E2E96D|nr:uncharacterized protein LOC6031152 [Culex quinquefasciatus]
MENINPAFKILNEIRQLGCTDEALCAVTYRTYLHLCEDRSMWDVQYNFSSQLNTLYLKARKQQDSPEDVYIPVPSFDSIPLERIEKLQAELVSPPAEASEPSGSQNGSRCLVLAVCDPSSTVLLYRMSNAIKPVFGKPLSRNKMLKQQAAARAGGGDETMEVQ